MKSSDIFVIASVIGAGIVAYTLLRRAVPEQAQRQIHLSPDEAYAAWLRSPTAQNLAVG